MVRRSRGPRSSFRRDRLRRAAAAFARSIGDARTAASRPDRDRGSRDRGATKPWRRRSKASGGPGTATALSRRRPGSSRVAHDLWSANEDVAAAAARPRAGRRDRRRDPARPRPVQRAGRRAQPRSAGRGGHRGRRARRARRRRSSTRTAIAEARLGGLLGVAAGSSAAAAAHQARLRAVRTPIARKRPDGSVPTVALVGKGITFDSGGLSLKSRGQHDDDEDRHERCGGRDRRTWRLPSARGAGSG